jgi:hypothetical protein
MEYVDLRDSKRQMKLLDGELKENEMSGACRMHVGGTP